MTAWSVVRDDVRRLCAAGGDERAVRAAVLRRIQTVVGFDHYVWVGTDPVTTVGASPLAAIPSLTELPRVVRIKYLTAANRWTQLTTDHVETLSRRPVPDSPWREMLSDYAVVDVASAVMRDRFGTWGFLDLWRSADTGPAFTAQETDFLASLLPALTKAMRLSVRSSFVPAAGATDSGPVVLVLSGELVPREQTPQTDAQLRSLLPTPAHLPPVPAAALNVAAQLLANEAGIDDHPAAARLAYAPGQWVTVRAARLSPPASGSEPDIVVTISRASTSERVEVYARALGLTSRETELVAFLVTGADTRGVAHSMGITEHTVNDHLKAIFSKAGTQSRRQLIANAAG